MYEELKNSAIGKKLIAAGYEIMNTGGGTMCWGRDTTYRTLILIGQGDGDIGEDGNEANWGTCVTREDGDYLEQHTKEGTLDECIAAMALLDAAADKMPQPGTRVEFTSEWEIFSSDLIVREGAKGTVVQMDGDFAVKMDDSFPALAEWGNEVHLNPGDFAADNGCSPAGWVLRHVRAI